MDNSLMDGWVKPSTPFPMDWRCLIIHDIELSTPTLSKILTNGGVSPQAEWIDGDEESVITKNWQDWVTVLGYLVFLGFIAWRVLANQGKSSGD